MVSPFDWLAFLRQWRFELEEVRVGGRAYYKVVGMFKELLNEFGKIPCVFVPDDRTIVIDEEDVIRKMASGEYPASPSFLKGRDWEQGAPRAARRRHQEQRRHVRETLRPRPAG